jgi:hypothetical protein
MYGTEVQMYKYISWLSHYMIQILQYNYGTKAAIYGTRYTRIINILIHFTMYGTEVAICKLIMTSYDTTYVILQNIVPK